MFKQALDDRSMIVLLHSRQRRKLCHREREQHENDRLLLELDDTMCRRLAISTTDIRYFIISKRKENLTSDRPGCLRR